MRFDLGVYVQRVEKFEAIGAGSDFALAALFLGKDSREAVEVACQLSIYCEEPIISFEMRR